VHRFMNWLARQVESDTLLDRVLGWEADAGDLPAVFEEVAGDFEEFFYLLVHCGWWLVVLDGCRGWREVGVVVAGRLVSLRVS